MCLEMGVIPVKYVLMAKRVNLLHYILNENTSSTMKQVYEALKCDSRKGDFYSLVQKDMKDLNIPCDETMITNYSKSQWKNLVKNQLKKVPLSTLHQKIPCLKIQTKLCLRN